MWTKTFRNRGSVDTCEHEQVTATTNYGLQRTVCSKCGHVSLGYLHDVLDAYQELDSAESLTTSSSDGVGSTS